MMYLPILAPATETAAAEVIHRPPEKYEISVLLPFDRPEAPAYTPRPRRTRVTNSRTAFVSKKVAQAAVSKRLFDIVITGRGTWAAAR
jgi:hypothetical protein